MKKVGIFLLISMLAQSGFAQRTCGTVEYNELLKKTNPGIKSIQIFEDWLEEKKQLLHSPGAMKQVTEEVVIYQIPVVVHIIHNGEAEGFGSNISYDQIVSQIEVLTEDFQRSNLDSVNTPSQFLPVASNVGFEFVLAKRDPGGLPTNGITRTQGTQSSWTMGDNTNLKSLSYWPAEDYLNIWVAPLAGGLLGWAEFPETSILSGLEDATGNSETDGVVIIYNAFGSIEKYPSANLQSRFNLGRSTSHEIGHFFGLRHIWGDGDCGVDDYVNDTPFAGDSYFDCPALGPSTTSCGSQDMFMNFMDYTDDDCMNIFTDGQKERMLVILNNSPRRLSLLSSPALEEPPLLDVAVTNILSPTQGICTNRISPAIEITNVGETDITAVEIALFINSSWVSQQTFTTAISTYEKTVLTMDSVDLTHFGTLEFRIQVLLVNGVTDASADNNEISQTSTHSETVTTLDEDFNMWPDDWSIRTDAPLSAWNTGQAPHLSLTNQAALLSYYKNPSEFTDELITPMIDLDQVSQAFLQFQFAYGYRNGSDDEFKIVVSTDCGTTFPDTLMLISGIEMATTYLPVEFTPSGPRDWKTHLLNLTPYLNEKIQIKFIGTSNGGNNLYLDDIKLVTAPINDLALIDLENETGVFCDDLAELGIVIENRGTDVATNFTLKLFENNMEITSQQFVNLNLEPGVKQTVYLTANLPAGQHSLEVKIDNVDDFPVNNSILRTVTKSSATAVLPYRQQFKNFNSLAASGWNTTTDYDHPGWEVSPTGGSNFSARYQAYTSGDKGVHSWLVSPRLDLSQSAEASMHFDLSYAENGSALDLVRIWASTDCGASFSILLDELYGSEISVASSTTEWNPSSEFDWRRFYIKLTEFSGMSDLIIGFEAIDADGNNIFIDNIEFFVSENEEPIEISAQTVAAYPNPVFDGNLNLTFNLNQKEDVDILVYDVLGNTVHTYHLQNVLNQTYPIEIVTTTSGVYYLKVVSPSIFNTLPVIVNR